MWQFPKRIWMCVMPNLNPFICDCTQYYLENVFPLPVALPEAKQRLDLQLAGDRTLNGGDWHYCVIVALQDVEHCMERN